MRERERERGPDAIETENVETNYRKEIIVIASRIPPRPLEAWRLEARCLRSHEQILALFWRPWAVLEQVLGAAAGF